jgi:hypothetical protein
MSDSNDLRDLCLNLSSLVSQLAHDRHHISLAAPISARIEGILDKKTIISTTSSTLEESLSRDKLKQYKLEIYVDELKQNNDKLLSVVNDREVSLLESKKEGENLCLTITKLRDEIDQLHIYLTEAEKRAEYLSQISAECTRKLEGSNEDTRRLQQDLQQALRANTSLTLQSTVLNDKMKRAQAEQSSLTNRLKALRADNIKKDAIITNLDTKVNELTVLETALINFEKKIENSDRELTKCHSEIALLSDSKNRLEYDLVQKQVNIDLLRSELQEKHDENRQLVALVLKLESKIASQEINDLRASTNCFPSDEDLTLLQQTTAELLSRADQVAELSIQNQKLVDERDALRKKLIFQSKHSNANSNSRLFYNDASMRLQHSIDFEAERNAKERAQKELFLFKEKYRKLEFEKEKLEIQLVDLERRGLLKQSRSFHDSSSDIPKTPPKPVEDSQSLVFPGDVEEPNMLAVAPLVLKIRKNAN